MLRVHSSLPKRWSSRGPVRSNCEAQMLPVPMRSRSFRRNSKQPAEVNISYWRTVQIPSKKKIDFWNTSQPTTASSSWVLAGWRNVRNSTAVVYSALLHPCSCRSVNKSKDPATFVYSAGIKNARNLHRCLRDAFGDVLQQQHRTKLKYELLVNEKAVINAVKDVLPGANFI